MFTLRTQEVERAREEHLKSVASSDVCRLCEKESLKSFVHWRITENNFPYDKVASVHHMLMSIRHVSENKLKIKQEFVRIEYDWIIESIEKSIPEHFHLHLIIRRS